MARRHLDRGNRLDAFEHPRDQRRSDPIIGEAALAGDCKEPRLDEPPEMLARGRARHAGKVRKLGAGERLAAHQCGQHGGTGGIAHKRCDFDQIGGGDHVHVLAPQSCGGQATTVRRAPNRFRATEDAIRRYP
jgi:hypothetical protein